MKISPNSYKVVREKQEFLGQEFQNKYGTISFDKYQKYLHEDFFVFAEGLKQECIRQSAVIYEFGKKQLIYGGFVDDMDDNAFAEAAEGYHFISINIGCWVKLKLLFDNLLSKYSDLTEYEVQNFKKVYDTVNESENPFILKAFDKSVNLELNDLKNLQISFDEDIEKTSVNMTLLCLEFLFCHEFMHITLGHTGLCRAKNWGVNKANEISVGNSIAHEMSNAKKAMEVMADLFAAETIGKNINSGRLFSLETKEQTDRLIWQFSYALTALFCAFDFSGANVRDYKLHFYPHPRVRLLMVISGFLNSIAKQEKKLDQIWESGLQLAFLSIRKLGLNVRFYGENYSEEKVEEDIEEYKKLYEDIKKATHPFMLNDFMW